MAGEPASFWTVTACALLEKGEAERAAYLSGLDSRVRASLEMEMHRVSGNAADAVERLRAISGEHGKREP